MAAPIQLGTAYETLHGPNPGHYHFTAGLIAYPDGLFPDPLALEYPPLFEPFSLEFGPYYFNDNEAETIFLLDCPIIYRILVLAREPNRLSRIDPRHLAALSLLPSPFSSVSVGSKQPSPAPNPDPASLFDEGVDVAPPSDPEDEAIPPPPSSGGTRGRLRRRPPPPAPSDDGLPKPKKCRITCRKAMPAPPVAHVFENDEDDDKDRDSPAADRIPKGKRTGRPPKNPRLRVLMECLNPSDALQDGDCTNCSSANRTCIRAPGLYQKCVTCVTSHSVRCSHDRPANDTWNTAHNLYPYTEFSSRALNRVVDAATADRRAVEDLQHALHRAQARMLASTFALATVVRHHVVAFGLEAVSKLYDVPSDTAAAFRFALADAVDNVVEPMYSENTDVVEEANRRFDLEDPSPEQIAIWQAELDAVKERMAGRAPMAEFEDDNEDASSIDVDRPPQPKAGGSRNLEEDE
ncbi:hypothetical protein DFH07DRAFT_969099 [Mycena maculata]|uniref:Uncharacterized protein n=1 Tax=Mycena maculata TaxID=230809 RepID=A0AAD7HY06_9AGAR|nr:hypothetical protein DFH07DRAFT_969099 [Mycena maculata]